MRMWETTNPGNPKSTGSKVASGSNKSDADDFYVFLFDEEDKSTFK